jgi:crotonobetainyl-CoA:carnitine CoA-transferase CaiB-like acyl-CoA transferase
VLKHRKTRLRSALRGRSRRWSRSKKPGWQAWVQSWLSGQDRSEESAHGVACVLAGTALVMAACEKLGEDLEAMREDVLYAQRQVEDLESMHEIRDVLSSQE